MADRPVNHVVVWMNYLKNAANEGDYTVISVLVAITVVVLTFFVFVLKGRGNKRRGVLLAGNCDAGKTLMFSQLVYGKPILSTTSMAINSGNYAIKENGKSLGVIDLPGSERVRIVKLDEHKHLARGVVFVVDSGTVQKEIKDIAEFLYIILSDSKISSMCPPVLIACNKQDVTTAKGATVIQSQLEKEMNTLRVTKSAALQDTSAGNNNIYLGNRDKNFTFADLKPMKVEFAECSCVGNKPDLDKVKAWLAKIA